MLEEPAIFAVMDIAARAKLEEGIHELALMEAALDARRAEQMNPQGNIQTCSDNVREAIHEYLIKRGRELAERV
ncbi:hypothetical protein [Spiribacter salinus]|uniref:hypothetical protein n=1 Tax=Spiribacter salinus TaxID=1335746 RepID=UPI001C95387C|nr:hypothetical protein [Spiribacter salinus]MBY5268294.1 hypothetical protein [Spiribacter salinus]